MGVNKLFERGLGLYPDRECLVDDLVRKTFAEVQKRRCEIAAVLNEQNAGPGTNVALYSPNCVTAFECLLGIYRAGAVFVPLNAKNHIDENLHLIVQGDVEIIFYHSDHLAEIDKIKAAANDVRKYICIDRNDTGDDGLDDMIKASSGNLPSLEPDLHRIVSIYSTGGTTGRPKGVTFTSLTWEMMAANLFAEMPVESPPVFLVVPPMTHAAGTIALLYLATGATIVIQKSFNAKMILDAIEREKITHLYLPPTAIYMLLDDETVDNRDYGSLKGFIYTSSPISTERLKRCLEVFGPVMIQFWGQTEAPIFCTCLPPQDHDLERPRQLSSCGRPCLLTEVAIMDPAGNLLPDDQPGEMVVRGNIVMSGYYKNPEATRQASEHGWHHTGDVGYRDAEGYFHIIDRLKDMIITGGFNVYPSEVERVLWEHEAIKECAVIGVPDPKWGEAVTAVVQLRNGYSVSEEELIAMCKAKLGSVKTPKSVIIEPDLPRTPVGKIDKKAIRQQFWQGQQRAI